MSKQNQKKNQRGVSILETMMASVIMAAGLIGLAQGLAISLMLDKESRNSISSLNLAQAKIETLKDTATSRTGYDALAGGSSQLRLDGAVYQANDQTADATNRLAYQMTWTITNGTDASGVALNDSTGNPAYKVIQVAITPLEGKLRNQNTITLITQVARPIS